MKNKKTFLPTLTERAIEELTGTDIKILWHVVYNYGVGFYGYLRKFSVTEVARDLKLSRAKIHRTISLFYDETVFRKIGKKMHYNPSFIFKCTQKRLPVLERQYYFGKGVDDAYVYSHSPEEVHRYDLQQMEAKEALIDFSNVEPANETINLISQLSKRK